MILALLYQGRGEAALRFLKECSPKRVLSIIGGATEGEVSCGCVEVQVAGLEIKT